MIEKAQVVIVKSCAEGSETGPWTAFKKGVTAEGLLSGSRRRGCGGSPRN